MGVPWRVLALLVATGCIRDNSVDCGDYACPAGLVCTQGGCATPEQAAACVDRSEGDACMTKEVADGTCVAGTCHAQVCGDHVVERGEICDDGNDVPGDGCSGDCRSAEVCGNGIVDGIAGEECDVGVAGLSGDGCSSTCTAEFAIWRDATPIDAIGPADGAAAYDSVRDRVITFGGNDAAGCGNVTREWDGDGWRTRSSPVSPAARDQHVLVYDARRHRTVLFGGSACSFGAQLADTWEWDGVTWAPVTPLASPPARWGHAAVFDGQHVVIFGGTDGTTTFDDVWEYDGTTWTQRVTNTGPTPRRAAAIAFDPVRSRIVVFGGQDAFGVLGDTWELADTTWSSPAVVGPPARASASASFDGAAVMVFGGDAGAPLGDTWLWDGTSWSNPTPEGPVPRRGHTSAFDSAHGVVILTGGVVGVSPNAETWEWDGALWQDVSQTRTPNPRFSSTLVFDAIRGEAVGFGGEPDQIGWNETWVWTGDEWIRRAPAVSPTRRGRAGLTYDARRGRVVMFGGRLRGALFRLVHLGDTWVWDGASWVEITPAQSPAPRASPLAYDSVRDRIVMFGGAGGSPGAPEIALSDTWEYDGASWIQRQPLHVPPARGEHVLVYDAHRRRVVMFGGTGDPDKLSDTWEWDGTDWTLMATAQTPPTTDTLSAAYDPVLQSTVLVTAGQVWDWNGVAWTKLYTVTQTPLSGSVTYDAVRRSLLLYGGESTAKLDFEPVDNAPVERCVFASIDDDHDKLAGCADPDCWARCSPLCPPGETCGAGQPRCGDGTCGPVEDYLICAADCPQP